MNPKIILALGMALLIASLTAWGFYERSGRMAALRDLETCKGKVELGNERIRESNRAVQALGTATAAAHAEAARLRVEREKKGGPLIEQILRLTERLKKSTPAGIGCKEGLQEWREGK